jgi:hypothetical protein
VLRLRPLNEERVTMARVKIVRPDGSPSPYFWRDEKEANTPLKTVYKKTSRGVKRLRGVRYDLAGNTFQKD